jgi:hypothetical protein
MPPMHKARAAVSSSPSAPLNHTYGTLRLTPPYVYGEGNLYGGGPVSHQQSLRTECAHSHLTQLRKKRIKRTKEPV